MDESHTPEPEPSSALGPPRRWPPTAIGVATPPPPRPRGGLRADRWCWRLYGPLYVFAAGCVAAGAGVVLVLPGMVARAVGSTVGVAGGLLGLLVVWLHSGAGRRWALWRRTRWIRRRRREVGPAPRPSA